MAFRLKAIFIAIEIISIDPLAFGELWFKKDDNLPWIRLTTVERDLYQTTKMWNKAWIGTSITLYCKQLSML